MRFEEREELYGRDEYYWGTEPSRLAERTVEHVPDDPAGLGLLDLGAGEGRDAVFFAERGFDVVAVDISPAGLEKAERLAGERGVEVTTVRADANELDPGRGGVPATVDVVFSSGVVQFVRPAVRDRQFERLRAMTSAGGLHAVFAFVDHPDVPPAPDTTDDQFLFGRDELQGYYGGWTTEHSEEIIFDDDSGGVPHQHAARIHVARAPES